MTGTHYSKLKQSQQEKTKMKPLLQEGPYEFFIASLCNTYHACDRIHKVKVNH